MTSYRLYQVNTGTIYATDIENQLYAQPDIYLLTLAEKPVPFAAQANARLDRSFLSIGTTVAPGADENRSGWTIMPRAFPHIIKRREVSEQVFLASYFPFLRDEEVYASSLQEIETAYRARLKKLNEEKAAQIAELGPKPTLDDRLQAFFNE